MLDSMIFSVKVAFLAIAIDEKAGCFMGSQHINYNPRMTKYLIDADVLSKQFLYLIDVGASGGIEQHWNFFGRHLVADGFEPLIYECNRLQQGSTPNINYHCYFVGSGKHDLQAEDNVAKNLFQRTSAVRAMQFHNYCQEKYNHDRALEYTDQKITIDDFLNNQTEKEINFIKIDTDGSDYQVLLGALDSLRRKNLLGITIESQLHGALAADSNTFRNIDLLLCQNGFTLYDLDIYRYTKKALPGEFFYQLPAQTKTGQTLWGEALYLRDFVGNNAFSHPENVYSIIKMACIQEIHGLSDCAAELILNFEDILTLLIDVKQCLDLLAQNLGFKNNYYLHNKLFDDNYKNFYPKK